MSVPGRPGGHDSEASPAAWSAAAAAAAIRSGETTSEELVGACLEHIQQVDAEIHAWAHLDPDYALEQARAADEMRKEGKPLGPLHGVPVGVKDIFDTKDMPTEDGTVLHAGRMPERDAAAVAKLREAGAVILGKTVATELGVYTPGKTRNPHHPEHTPGGSSSGSAASVAAHMVPLAIGTQTNGSVIRPASFCGVYGFKPSHGLISRHLVLQQSRTLDHVGVFARTIEDCALAVEVLQGYDERDPDTRPRAAPAILEAANQDPPVTPQLAFVKTPVWDRAEDDTEAAFAELVEHLGETVKEEQLPPDFDDVLEVHRTIFEADLARSFKPEYERGRDELSEVLCEIIERGRDVRAVAYNDAVGRIGELRGLLAEVFERCDVILTPAAPGEAPQGLGSTGDPAFCTLWTLCGLPAITLPLLQGSRGLPMGVQLVAPKGDDARLLRTARWLLGQVAE